MKIQLLRYLDDHGPCDMGEIVRGLRVSARIVKPAIDVLITENVVYEYTPEQYARDSGDPLDPSGVSCFGTDKSGLRK